MTLQQMNSSASGAPTDAKTKRQKARGGVADLPLSVGDHAPIGVNLLALNEAIAAGGYRGQSHRLDADRAYPLAHGTLSAAKRAFDIVAAASALLVLLPVLALCACAVRMTSPGPVFFRQRRLGQGGEEFSILKFRTMVLDSEARLQHLLATDPQARIEWDADHKLRSDPRVTTIGGFLRRFSLDELPQFWNVLVGEMSMVGPRPIVRHEVPRYREAFSTYTKVRPGITGLWQVSGRNDTGYEERVSLDCRYVQNWSPMMELRILIKTVGTVISAAGAY
jgi:Undecaprenyl-phosphate galactose phosphotransferase WbaP